MWLGGEEAGHHAGIAYDSGGYRKLRAELLKDFRTAPSLKAFGGGGSIRTVRDLAAAMAGVPQTPVPSTSAVLGRLLPREEVAILSRQRLRAVVFHECTARDATTRRLRNSRIRPKKTAGRKPKRKK
jgi:hypothetical protein